MSSSTGRSSLILSCLLLLQGLRLGYFCLVSQGAPASTVCLLLLLPLLQGLRIDYFLLTPGLLDKVVACEMVPTPPKWSDHTGTGGAGGEYLPGCKGGAAEAERGVCVSVVHLLIGGWHSGMRIACQARLGRQGASGLAARS